jgi:hypothetical protein
MSATKATSYYPKEEARFAKDTAEHAMTILHSDGLYRHLRFKKPGTIFYYFDLITWPGYLTIAGDMGTYTFERVEDMFTFFRASSDINPQYWGEKVRAGSGTNGTITKEYSEDLFKKHVSEHVAEYVEYKGLSKAERKSLIKAVKLEILEGGESYYESGARDSLADFSEVHEGSVFSDTWEWDLTDYTVQFLWCCFAIRWGISQFDATKEEKTA